MRCRPAPGMRSAKTGGTKRVETPESVETGTANLTQPGRLSYMNSRRSGNNAYASHTSRMEAAWSKTLPSRSPRASRRGPRLASRTTRISCTALCLRRRMNNELNFPPNFERLVLGCIAADFCKKILVGKLLTRSTRYFCTAQISKFQPTIVNISRMKFNE